MLDDDGSGLPERNSRFEAAWQRYLIAEQRALVARAEGILARSLDEALPGESQEELDRTAEEDRRLARQGFVELMDEEGVTYHKHLDELEVWDVADRLRADTARSDRLAMRARQRNEQRKAWLSDRGRPERRRPTLTDRELEILKGLARGLSNSVLAEEVHLSTAVCNRTEPVCKPSALSYQPSAKNKKLKADGANCRGSVPLQFAIRVP